VRYYDDFDEKYRTVRDLAGTDAWAVVVNGQNHTLKLAVGEPWHTHLLKVFVADLLANRATTTTSSYVSALASLQPGLLVRVIEAIALERRLPTPGRSSAGSWTF
jgi:hypothetical protein